MREIRRLANGWSDAPINDVAHIEFGTRVTKKLHTGTRYPVYGGGGATFLMDESNREDCYVVSRFGMSEECVRRVDGKFFLNDSGLTVKSRDASRLLQGFLDAYLFGAQSRIFDLGRGAAQKNLNVDAFRELLVPLPPLDEQKRIVAVLDQAFAALDRARVNAEASMADAETLFDAELRLQFETAAERAGLLPFDSVCEPLTPKLKLKRQDYLGEGKYPVVSQETDLISGYWNDPTALMGASGPVVVFGDHTCCLKLVEFDFVVGADGTKVLEPVEGVSAKYLYYGLRSQPIQQSGYARHYKLLRETVLPDLPTAEQDRITDHLGNLEARCLELASSYETTLADADALRQSLLQAAFSGQM